MDPCRETPWPAVLFRFLSDDLMSQLSFWHLLVQYIRYLVQYVHPEVIH